MKNRLKKKQSKLSYQARKLVPRYESFDIMILETTTKLEEIASKRGMSVLDLFIKIDDELSTWTEEEKLFHSLNRRLGTAKAMKEKQAKNES